MTHGTAAVWGTECSLNCQLLGFQIPRVLFSALTDNRSIDFSCSHSNRNLSFQDGTFLVRDSSKKTITNPYVLMVLYKDKVYNIQIRYQEENQVYLLGTGLRGKEVRASNYKISLQSLFMSFCILTYLESCCSILCWGGAGGGGSILYGNLRVKSH